MRVEVPETKTDREVREKLCFANQVIALIDLLSQESP
jgi:hypothetical protein